MTETPTPTIKSLSSRHANKDARAAFNYTALLITPLPDGTFALCDRTQNFYLVVPEPPTREAFLLYHKLLNTSRMTAETRFYGEPTDKDFASDLKRGFKPALSNKTQPLNLEITL